MAKRRRENEGGGDSERQSYRYLVAAARYIQQVTSGELEVCSYVRAACERQADDVKAWQEGRFRFRMEPDLGERVCAFIERLPHVRGRWKTANLKLEPWQCFILTTVFGWVDEHGNRRFRSAYIEVPRKNGKSALTAGVGLYMLAADGEAGAECFSLATKREQALAVWTVARFMALKNPALCHELGIEVRAHSVMADGGASYFQALASEENGLDGLNPHFASIDELHAHRNRMVHDVISSGTGARAQPLLWEITTAGSDIAGICYEQRDYTIKVLEATLADEQHFGIVYTIDKGDIEGADWFSERLWRKANPNYGVSVNPVDFESKARKASAQPGALSEFLRTGLDVWTQADSPWMDMHAWQACTDTSLRLEDFRGKHCWVGEDLASKIDVAAKVRVFDVDGIVYVLARDDAFFVPQSAVRDSNNAQYEGWERGGFLVATPGNIIDFEYIQDSLREDAKRFEVGAVGYDPHQATQHATTMMGEGFPMVEVRQTVLGLSEPMKELEALVLSRRLKHDGNPVLTWMMSNVVAHYDKKDNIYPNKQRVDKKIDGVIALIMALALRSKELTGGYAEGRLVAM
jgi:phage terminase large subunit-like protein